MDGVKFALRLAAVASVSAFSLTAVAQTISAPAEVARRSGDSQDALGLLKKGDEAYEKGDYASAVKHYQEAVGKLPEQANIVSDLRSAAVQRFAQAAVEQARHLGRRGDYPAANALLDEVDNVVDRDPGVEKMRAKLLDPIRTNPAGSKEHTARVDEVRRALYEAEGYLDSGQFDRAELAYEDVIRLDPYNNAARRGMERVMFHKSDYAGAAYDHARAKLLADVDKEWELRKFELLDVPVIEGGADEESRLQIAATLEKLRLIKVPIVDLEDATLEEAIDFLRVTTKQNDTLELDESLKGVDFIVELGNDNGTLVQKVKNSRVNVPLRNVTVEQVLKVITEMTRTQYRIDEYAVVITPLGATNTTLISRDFRVPPDFLSRGAALNGASEDPFTEDTEEGGALLAKRLTAREKLLSLGVAFPDGASASYMPGTNTLTVRNTVENVDYISRVVSMAVEAEPVMVVIRTTIMEVSQEGLDELAYDWTVGQFGGGDFTLGGGTTGNGGGLSDMIGAPVTSGLRNGDGSAMVDNLDSVLNRDLSGSVTTGSVSLNTASSGVSSNTLSVSNPNTVNSRAPGAVTVRGVFGNGFFQTMLRGMKQKKGVDVMSRPEVITRSGQNAVIKSVREFIYPDEYEPPEIPNSVGSTTLVDLDSGTSASPGSAIATPSTPTSFLTTDVGVILDVLPQVSADRKYIDLSIKPVIRDFEGFVNYGTPITGGTTAASFNLSSGIDITSTVGELTPNEILKPLFRTIRENTQVTVADGATVVIGGQLSESRQDIEDKVPVLGDLPFVGRFFKSSSVSTRKRSIFIMVNVELQDPSGKSYRNR